MKPGRMQLNLKAGVVILLFGIVGVSLSGGSPSTQKRKQKETPAPVWPAPPDPPRIKFINSISSPKDLKLKQSSTLKRLAKKLIGLDSEEFSILSPYGVATDSRNRLIVVDLKLRLAHVFDTQGKKYFTIRPPNQDAFISPVGVAVDGEDNIFISDSYTGRVLIFDRGGKFKKRLGPQEGLFNRPTGIAIDKASRRLYVVETVKGEVDVLDLSGRELSKFGHRGYGKGEFNYPTQICLKGDRLFVTDTLNARVQVFDKDGNFISMLGQRGDGVGDLDKPKGVGIDSEGHIYIVEGLHDTVQVFDQQGGFLLAFGGTGSDKGEFYLPTAIHIDDDDNVYVSDSYNRRVQVFKYLKNASSTGN